MLTVQDGTFKLPQGWEGVPDAPTPMAGDFIDYDDYVSGGQN